MDRLNGRLGGSDSGREPEIELKFSLPDMWSGGRFIAICCKDGARPYRYVRQRRKTFTVRVCESVIDRTVWLEFRVLHPELKSCFEDVTDHLANTHRAFGRRRQRSRPTAVADRMKLP